MLDLTYLRIGACFILSTLLYPVTALGYWLARLAASRVGEYRFSAQDAATFGLDLVFITIWSVVALMLVNFAGGAS